MFHKKDSLVAYPLWRYTEAYLKRRYAFTTAMFIVLIVVALAALVGWRTTGVIMGASLGTILIVFLASGKTLAERLSNMIKELFQ